MCGVELRELVREVRVLVRMYEITEDAGRLSSDVAGAESDTQGQSCQRPEPRGCNPPPKSLHSDGRYTRHEDAHQLFASLQAR